MRIRFLLQGEAYSSNKDDFKRILKKHGLAWKGSFDNIWWGSEREKVTAFFERDEVKDVTLSATLTWEGRKRTELLEELKGWVKELGGEVSELKADVARGEKEIERQLEFWDKLNKPNIDYLRSQGRPEAWIKRDLEEWRKKRRERKKELLSSMGS